MFCIYLLDAGRCLRLELQLEHRRRQGQRGDAELEPTPALAYVLSALGRHGVHLPRQEEEASGEKENLQKLRIVNLDKNER